MVSLLQSHDLINYVFSCFLIKVDKNFPKFIKDDV